MTKLREGTKRQQMLTIHRAAGHNEENTVFTEKVNLGPLFAGCMTWCSGTCWARCGEAKMRRAVCSTEHHACPGRPCAVLSITPVQGGRAQYWASRLSKEAEMCTAAETTPLPIGRPTVVTDDDLLGLWEPGCHFYVYFVTVFWRWSCFPSVQNSPLRN